MNYTAEQLADFKVAVAQRRKRVALAYLAMSLPFYGLMFAFLKGEALGLSRLQWGAIVLAVVVAGQLFARSVLRCPGCGTSFQLKQVSCPNCGLPIGRAV